MQEHRQVERLDFCQNRLEERIVQITIVDVRAHVDAAHAGQLGGAIEFVNGAIRIKHRQDHQRDQPSRIRLVRLARSIVPRSGEFQRKIGIGPVDHWRAQRERLYGDTLPIHIREPPLQINDLGRQWSNISSGRVHIKAFAGHAIVSFEALAFCSDEVKKSLRIIVRMRIDGTHAGRIERLLVSRFALRPILGNLVFSKKTARFSRRHRRCCSQSRV